MLGHWPIKDLNYTKKRGLSIFRRGTFLIFEGHAGWEYSNADKLADKYQNRYVSVRFGINYYLSNIIGG